MVNKMIKCQLGSYSVSITSPYPSVHPAAFVSVSIQFLSFSSPPIQNTQLAVYVKKYFNDHQHNRHSLIESYH